MSDDVKQEMREDLTTKRESNSNPGVEQYYGKPRRLILWQSVLLTYSDLRVIRRVACGSVRTIIDILWSSYFEGVTLKWFKAWV